MEDAIFDIGMMRVADRARPRWADDAPWCSVDCPELQRAFRARCSLTGSEPLALCLPVVSDVVGRVRKAMFVDTTPPAEMMEALAKQDGADFDARVQSNIQEDKR